MAEDREVNQQRVKRLMEYDVFNFNVLAENPSIIQWFNDAVGMYDWSLAAKMNLNVAVSLDQARSQGGAVTPNLSKGPLFATKWAKNGFL